MTKHDAVIRFGVSMEKRLLEQFDRLLQRKGYATRSEAIRDLIRAEMVRTRWQQGRSTQIGVLTLVYDHHKTDLQHHLTDIQHRHGSVIITSVHVHMDKDNCLEVLILKGPGSQVHKLAEQLRSTKGVKHGELMTSTTGKSI